MTIHEPLQRNLCIFLILEAEAQTGWSACPYVHGRSEVERERFEKMQQATQLAFLPMNRPSTYANRQFCGDCQNVEPVLPQSLLRFSRRMESCPQFGCISSSPLNTHRLFIQAK